MRSKQGRGERERLERQQEADCVGQGSHCMDFSFFIVSWTLDFEKGNDII